MYKNIIPIGSDHAGFELKKLLISFLEEKGFTVKDFGCYSDESIDYPDFGHPVAEMVEANESMLGIVICGSGNGIAMTVNKHQDIRAALCWTKEIAALARLHNDANIISIPARYTSIQQAIEMVEAFLTTSFEGGRHANRVHKIACK
jgi:ribose 5-phosphate isomerase B